MAMNTRETAHRTTEHGRRFWVGTYVAVLLIVCGYITWEVIAVRDYKNHEDQFRGRLYITDENVFGVKPFESPDDGLRIYGVIMPA